jgi:beta-aspartyl-peptidase (threonine type)
MEATAAKGRKTNDAMTPATVLVHGGAGKSDRATLAERRAGCEQAAEIAWRLLEAGGDAVDAVAAAVESLEEHPLFNAGVGSCLTSAGSVEMDASFMDGRRPAGGGVALVTSVLHPVRLARAVAEDGRHVLLAGPGAEAFARERGLETAPPQHFVTDRQLKRWKARATVEGGTVGAVAVDRRGHVAAATSTGGLSGKLPGRIGDSAVIGAGTYADDRAGAASATGLGERILSMGLARRSVDLLRHGLGPNLAARHVLGEIATLGGGAGLILVDRFGRIAWAFDTEEMTVGIRPRRAGNA